LSEKNRNHQITDLRRRHKKRQTDWFRKNSLTKNVTIWWQCTYICTPRYIQNV
jgi:hypothetical protein